MDLKPFDENKVVHTLERAIEQGADIKDTLLALYTEMETPAEAKVPQYEKFHSGEFDPQEKIQVISLDGTDGFFEEILAARKAREEEALQPEDEPAAVSDEGEVETPAVEPTSEQPTQPPAADEATLVDTPAGQPTHPVTGLPIAVDPPADEPPAADEDKRATGSDRF